MAPLNSNQQSRTTTTTNSCGSSSRSNFSSVLSTSRFRPLKAPIASRVQKVLRPTTTTTSTTTTTTAIAAPYSPQQSHQLAASLVRFLELKIVLQEYSPDPSQHLLAATTLLEQAWFALYEDCKLYPQVITSIQEFHGQPNFHVFLRRSSLLGAQLLLLAGKEEEEEREEEEGKDDTSSSSDEEYFARLARTQSLMQCYYRTTMPNSLRELQHQSATMHIHDIPQPQQPQQRQQPQQPQQPQPLDDDIPKVIIPVTPKRAITNKMAQPVPPQQNVISSIYSSKNHGSPTHVAHHDTYLFADDSSPDNKKNNNEENMEETIVFEHSEGLAMDDIPIVVIPENDSTFYSDDDEDDDDEDNNDEDNDNDSYTNDEDDDDDSYTNDDEEDDSESEQEVGDGISYTSSLTNSTGLASSHNPICHLMTMLWKQSCTNNNGNGNNDYSTWNTNNNHRNKASCTYRYADYAKEPSQPVRTARARKHQQMQSHQISQQQQQQQQQLALQQDDITESATDSEDTTSNNNNNNSRSRNNKLRGKKRYQKLNRRWEEFMCYWA